MRCAVKKHNLPRNYAKLRATKWHRHDKHFSSYFAHLCVTHTYTHSPKRNCYSHTHIYYTQCALTPLTCSLSLIAWKLLIHIYKRISLTHIQSLFLFTYLLTVICAVCCINNLLPFTLFHFSFGILFIHLFIIFPHLLMKYLPLLTVAQICLFIVILKYYRLQ